MSLDLPHLLPQVNALSDSVAKRQEQFDQLVPNLLHRLEQAVNIDLELLEKKRTLAGENWPGAIPSDEPIQASYPAEDLPESFTVIAADGSQIHPDRHAIARYYLINIGSIKIRYGSGEVPQTSIESSLFFEDEHLYDERGIELGAAVINALRDVSEMEVLARLADSSQEGPLISLLDNGLLLWLAAQAGDRPSDQVLRIMQQYIQQLSRLHASGGAIAGFIDRPRHASVISLLHLDSLALEEITEETLRINPFVGLSDRALFNHVLNPGHRSALFIQNSRLNRDFKKHGHEVCFFYLHPGGQNQVVRIEVPNWVAGSPDLLNLVHGSVIEQCKMTGGYPYSLVRAHELAVVSTADRQALETMIQNSMMHHKWIPKQSLKSETKGWIRKKRRHRI
jgi:hypothetical protein